MLHHLAERVLPALTLEVGVGDALFELRIGQLLQKCILSTFDLLPAAIDGGDVGKCVRDRKLLGRAVLPSLEPHPFGAEDVAQRVADRAEAVAEIAGEMSGIEGTAGVHDAVIRPLVVRVEVPNV